jgi:hypothetical protein
LKPEEALKYHEEWLQSIIRRASSVTFDEINLFTIFTYRCDPKFFTSIGSGVNSRLFTNKLFMNQAYFKNIATLKAFVTLFDIAFARFTEHFNLEEGDHRAMNLDVFSMLGVYNKFIYSGLDTLKNRAEATKIQIQFLEILSKSLTGRITPLTIHILQALWTYLISTNEVGIFCFKHRTRDQVSRNIAIFSQLINHLKILPKDFHRKHEIPIEQLMIAYEYHKPQFIKELSKAKNEEIWDFLTEKVTEDYIAMGRSLKVVSEVDDLAVFDGDLLAQIEKELLGSGPASKGAHP